MDRKASSVRITKISVQGLFGMFDHEIPLNRESRITIVHGPNGVGKTVLMQMVHGLFNYDYSYVAFGVPFGQIQIEFENGLFITVEAVELDRDGDTITVSASEWPLDHGLRICFDDGASAQSEFTLAVPEHGKGEMLWSLTVKGHFFGDLFQRVETGNDTLWLAKHRLFTTEELLDAIPELHDAACGVMPEWFGSIRQESNTSLIRISRVNMVDTKGWIDFGRGYEHAEEDGLGYGSAISAISESIKAIPRGEPIVRNRDRIKAIMAMEDFESEDPVLEDYLESAYWKEDFTGYIAKRRMPFATYHDAQILFEEIINERFSFKSFKVDAEVGLRFVSDGGEHIECESLSSGEQHLLVLYYQLVFETEPDTLVMIDEPELSMNVVWQRNFIKDLQRIVELRKFDVLIATHSPEVIYDKWDWTVALGEKVDD